MSFENSFWANDELLTQPVLHLCRLSVPMSDRIWWMRGRQSLPSRRTSLQTTWRRIPPKRRLDEVVRHVPLAHPFSQLGTLRTYRLRRANFSRHFQITWVNLWVGIKGRKKIPPSEKTCSEISKLYLLVVWNHRFTFWSTYLIPATAVTSFEFLQSVSNAKPDDMILFTWCLDNRCQSNEKWIKFFLVEKTLDVKERERKKSLPKFPVYRGSLNAFFGNSR